jgi:hypothetical protein
MSPVALLLSALAATTPPLAGSPALISPDGRYSISPKRMAAGGGATSDARFAMHATFGQPEASAALTAGRFMATLGLRQRRNPVDPHVFRDGFE